MTECTGAYDAPLLPFDVPSRDIRQYRHAASRACLPIVSGSGHADSSMRLRIFRMHICWRIASWIRIDDWL